MPASFSPSIRRRRLSTELKRLRADRGLTLQEAAKQAGMGKSNLSKIEKAETKTVPKATLDSLLDLYAVTDPSARGAMHELAKLAGQRGWWTQYRDRLPEMLADFEAEACALRTFQAQVVPGLLQTPDYADAVFRANRVRDDAEVRERVEGRIQRQHILNRHDPPTFTAILDEAVLRRTVGSAEVMRTQLRHLTHMAARHNIDLYVLPLSAGAHPATEGSFVVMDFPDPRDSSIAYIETPATSMYLEEDHQIRACNDMFGSAQGAALTPTHSLVLIRDVMQSLEE